MASVDGCNDVKVGVLRRCLVKGSDSSIEPHVLAFSNLDLLTRAIRRFSMVCIYPNPPGVGFEAVVAVFRAGLPSLLNQFFPLAGRLVTNPSSGLPELHCNNQGGELAVGEAGVALASLDYGNMGASLRRIQLPYDEDVALSVQVVSFACGGFTVTWCTNHLLADGKAMSLLVSAWSELARSAGTLAAEARPNHDRSVFRPRAPPSYSTALGEAFTPLDAERQVNVLTTEQSFVERLYYIEASDIARLREAASRDGERATRVQAVSAYLWKALAGVVGTADPHCRMGWWVDGRRRLTEPDLRVAMHNYFGNVVALALREASVQEVLRMPLPDVAAMVREAITSPAYDEHFQELVDWVEDRKTKNYYDTATIGLGSPAVSITVFASFQIDTDFGFGYASMAMPTTASTARLCSGFFQIVARPGCDGSWFTSGLVWPRLAAALESDEQCFFKPVTAEFLGLSCSSTRAEQNT